MPKISNQELTDPTKGLDSWGYETIFVAQIPNANVVVTVSTDGDNIFCNGEKMGIHTERNISSKYVQGMIDTLRRFTSFRVHCRDLFYRLDEYDK